MALGTTALVALTVGDTLLGFASHRQAAGAAKREAGATAALDEQNAQYAEQQAEDAIIRGDKEVGKQKATERQTIGSQRAAAAASGVDVGYGSALELQLDAKGLGAMDRAEIKNNAMLEAWGYKQEASNYRSQGKLALMAGRNRAKAENMASYSTLLTGAAKVGDIYSKK